MEQNVQEVLVFVQCIASILNQPSINNTAPGLHKEEILTGLQVKFLWMKQVKFVFNPFDTGGTHKAQSLTLACRLFSGFWSRYEQPTSYHIQKIRQASQNFMYYKSYNARHKKTDLTVFVVVIPKEGWAHVAAPILLLVWHRLFRIWVFWLHRSYSRQRP